jgi:hypothetical protein
MGAETVQCAGFNPFAGIRAYLTFAPTSSPISFISHAYPRSLPLQAEWAAPGEPAARAQRRRGGADRHGALRGTCRYSLHKQSYLLTGLHGALFFLCMHGAHPISLCISPSTVTKCSDVFSSHQVRESMTIAEHGLDAKASFSAAAK